MQAAVPRPAQGRPEQRQRQPGALHVQLHGADPRVVPRHLQVHRPQLVLPGRRGGGLRRTATRGPGGRRLGQAPPTGPSLKVGPQKLSTHLGGGVFQRRQSVGLGWLYAHTLVRVGNYTEWSGQPAMAQAVGDFIIKKRLVQTR